MEYPIHLRDLKTADPFILADPETKKYYMYANQFGFDPDPGEKNAFYVIESTDLVKWSLPSKVFTQGDFWASEDYSGPEVYYRNGAYYLIAAFSAPGRLRRIQALKADSPKGPFAPVGEPLTPDAWQCMDGTLYVDKKGKTWLVFAHDWVQVYDGQICAIPVSDDLTHSIGKPVVLFRGSDADWGDDFMYSTKAGGGGAASGPCVHRMENGNLVILWSNQTPYGDAIGIARSLSGEIWGPWEQFEKPTYAIDGKHPSLFRRFEDGMLLMPFYSDVEGGVGTTTLLAEMEEYWRTGLLEIIHECTGNFRCAMGGHAVAYRNAKPTLDEPTFTVMQDYGGHFAKRIVNWAMAPETPFKKGKIATKD